MGEGGEILFSFFKLHRGWQDITFDLTILLLITLISMHLINNNMLKPTKQQVHPRNTNQVETLKHFDWSPVTF